MTKAAKWHKSVDEALKSVKIGTQEEVFLTAEVKGLETSKEISEKNLEQIEWIKAIYDKRIKEIEDET